MPQNASNALISSCLIEDFISDGSGGFRAASTYTTEITTVDAQGMMVPMMPFSLTSDRAATLIVNGVAMPCLAKSPLPLTTGTNGKTTITVEATALTSPEFTMSWTESPDNGAAQNHSKTWRSDLGVYAKLAGQVKTFPMNGKALIASGIVAKTNTQADDYATALKSVAQSMLKFAGPLHQPHERAAWSTQPDTTMDFELDLTAASGPRLTLHPAGALRLEALPGTAPGTSWLSYADVVADWGSLANYVEKSVSQVVSVVTSAVAGGLQFVITVAGKVQHFLLKTADQVADAMTAFLVVVGHAFKTAVDLIPRVIAWVREVFAWPDILNTKKVFRYQVDQALTKLSGAIAGQLIPFVNKEFAGLEDGLDDMFKSIEAVFKQQSFSQFTKTHSSSHAVDISAEQTKHQQTQSQHAVRTNYVSSRIQEHFAAPAHASALFYSGPSSAALDSLMTTVQQQFEALKFADAFQKIQDLLSPKANNPQAFFDVVIVDLLEVVRALAKLVLTIIKDIIVDLLTLLGGAIDGFHAFLKMPLDIPVLSAIYVQYAGGEPLSLLDAFCLMIAAPVTILYKVMRGDTSPVPPFTAQDVAAITAAPIPWIPAAQGGLLGAAPTGTLQGPIFSDSTRAWIFLVLSFLYSLWDAALDGMAFAGADDDPSANAVEVGYSIAAVVFSILLMIFALPNFSTALTQKASGWILWAWILGWITIAVDLLFMIFGSKKAVKRLSAGGVWIDCGFGVIAMVLAGLFIHAVVSTSDSGYGGLDIAGNLLGPLPSILKPLTLAPNPWTVGILLVADIGCATADGVLEVVGAHLVHT